MAFGKPPNSKWTDEEMQLLAKCVELNRDGDILEFEDCVSYFTYYDKKRSRKAVKDRLRHFYGDLLFTQERYRDKEDEESVRKLIEFKAKCRQEERALEERRKLKEKIREEHRKGIKYDKGFIWIKTPPAKFKAEASDDKERARRNI